MPDEPAPIIVIKRKKIMPGGHHGGAWKVAYADFVTALMALFIVLWLLNASKDVQEAVAGYFNDPKGYAKGTGTGKAGVSDGVTLSRADIPDLKRKLEQAMQETPELTALKEQVEISMTSEGLRIELLETETGIFFGSGSPVPGAQAELLLARLAQELGKMPVALLMEGHTDSRPYTGTQVYSNWELSTERANAARRVMQNAGVGPRQVKQVRGFADQKLRKPNEPTDASNRRISIIVQLPGMELPTEAVPAVPAAAPAHPPGAAPAETHKKTSSRHLVSPQRYGNIHHKAQKAKAPAPEVPLVLALTPLVPVRTGVRPEQTV